MAGKGGGAWKVAYADFVTAMMAFFLVMWIVSQEQKIKEAVAHYFIDPMGFHPIGSSDNPGQPGSLFDGLSGGNVPGGRKSQMGKGRNDYHDQALGEQATRAVHDWLRADAQLLEQWKAETREAREHAEQSPEVLDGGSPANEIAAQELAVRLRDEFVNGVPADVPAVYQDLIYSSIGSVNWRELAEEFLEAE
jgi:flagellar motor protein MotB